jgi:hypothetical protein
MVHLTQFHLNGKYERPNAPPPSPAAFTATSIWAFRQIVWTSTIDDFPSSDLTRIYCGPDMNLTAALSYVWAAVLLAYSIKP